MHGRDTTARDLPVRVVARLDDSCEVEPTGERLARPGETEVPERIDEPGARRDSVHDRDSGGTTHATTDRGDLPVANEDLAGDQHLSVSEVELLDGQDDAARRLGLRLPREAPSDPGGDDGALHGCSGEDHQVTVLAWCDRSDAIRDTENLGRRQRDRAQGVGCIQPLAHGRCGRVSKILTSGAAARSQREAHTLRGQLRGRVLAGPGRVLTLAEVPATASVGSQDHRDLRGRYGGGHLGTASHPVGPVEDQRLVLAPEPVEQRTNLARRLRAHPPGGAPRDELAQGRPGLCSPLGLVLRLALTCRAVREVQELIEPDDRSHRRSRQLRLLHTESDVHGRGDRRLPEPRCRARLARDRAMDTGGARHDAVIAGRTPGLDHRALTGDQAAPRRGDVRRRDAARERAMVVGVRVEVVDRGERRVGRPRRRGGGAVARVGQHVARHDRGIRAVVDYRDTARDGDVLADRDDLALLDQDGAPGEYLPPLDEVDRPCAQRNGVTAPVRRGRVRGGSSQHEGRRDDTDPEGQCR